MNMTVCSAVYVFVLTYEIDIFFVLELLFVY